MLNASTIYKAQQSARNIASDWLLELSYEDTVAGDGTFYLSGSTRTITNLYHGIVLDWGVITEKIDLSKSQSSISDVTIEVQNKWANNSGLLSAGLFGGNQKFINMDVVIRSWIPGVTTAANCLTLYKGRLVDIQHDDSTVTFSIEKRSPWDRVKIPNDEGGTATVYSDDRKIMFPSAYGVFTHNASTVAAKDFIPSKSLYPMPINSIVGDNLMCLLANRASPLNENPHYYQKDLDMFAPLDPANNTAVSYEGGLAVGAATTLKRGFDCRPYTITAGSTDFLAPGNAIDGNVLSNAIKSIDTTTPGTYDYYLDIDVPNVLGRITSLLLKVKYAVQIVAGSSGTPTLYLFGESYGTGSPQQHAFEALGSSDIGVIHTGAETIHTVTGYGSVQWLNADRYSANNTFPETIKLHIQFGLGSGRIIGQCLIYDVFIRPGLELNTAGEEEAANSKLEKIEQLYTGTDGLVNSWTDGSGTASLPHDIYRDMLARYTSWDAASENAVQVNGADWDTTGTPGISIDEDRDWPCRWWTLEQKSLLAVLKKLQFEGCFIWIFDDVESGREARVIYVQSSYSTTDFTIDGTQISKPYISLTPFSKIVTKRTFNYQRHPADDSRYLATNSLENDNRGDYNLGADENAIEQDLDFLTDSDDVDEALAYYDNIDGEPALMVKCDLYKPADWAMQVGDTADFENMNYTPYGKAWADLTFMCVQTDVSPRKFTATFRQVEED